MQGVFALDTRPSRQKRLLYPDTEDAWQHARVDGFDTYQAILITIRSVLELDILRQLHDETLSLQGLTDHARSLLRALIPTFLYVYRLRKPETRDEARELIKRFYLVDRHGEWLAENPQVDKRILQSHDLCGQLRYSNSSRTWEILAHNQFSLSDSGPTLVKLKDAILPQDRKEVQSSFPLFPPFFILLWFWISTQDKTPLSDAYKSRYYEICKTLGVPDTFCWHDFVRFFQNVYRHHDDVHQGLRHDIRQCCRPIASPPGVVQPSSTFDVVSNAYVTPERDSVDLAREIEQYGSLSNVLGDSTQISAIPGVNVRATSEKEQTTEHAGVTSDELLKGFILFDLSEPLLEKSSHAGQFQVALPHLSQNKHYCSFRWDSNHDAVERQVASDLARLLTLQKGRTYRTSRFSIRQFAGGKMFFPKGQLYIIVPLGSSSGAQQNVTMTSQRCTFNIPWVHSTGCQIYEEATLATQFDIYYVCIMVLLRPSGTSHELKKALDD